MGVMAAHRANVLVTSCLRTPVDPHTKAPLASYERAGGLREDHRDQEEVRSPGRFCPRGRRMCCIPLNLFTVDDAIEPCR